MEGKSSEDIQLESEARRITLSLIAILVIGWALILTISAARREHANYMKCVQLDRSLEDINEYGETTLNIPGTTEEVSQKLEEISRCFSIVSINEGRSGNVRKFNVVFGMRPEILGLRSRYIKYKSGFNLKSYFLFFVGYLILVSLSAGFVAYFIIMVIVLSYLDISRRMSSNK